MNNFNTYFQSIIHLYVKLKIIIYLLICPRFFLEILAITNTRVFARRVFIWICYWSITAYISLTVVNLIFVFTFRFYLCRSQKHKKLLDLTDFFSLLGSACVKAACKMLVKLTPDLHTGNFSQKRIVQDQHNESITNGSDPTKRLLLVDT